MRRWREDARPGLAALVHLPPAPSGESPLDDDPHPPLDPAVVGGEAIAAARLLADAFPGTPLVVTGVPRRDARGAEGLAVALAHLMSGAGS